MILITTGSQKFQFDRLIKKVDELVGAGMIEDTVFAQIGSGTYKPQNIEYCDFLDREAFQKKMDECSMVITHGGTGVIINAVKKGKKVIAVPRLAQYGEHVDDHQIQLLEQFDEMNLICSCYNIEELGKCYQETLTKEFMQYQSNTQKIIQDIETYLCGEKKAEEGNSERKRLPYLDVAKGIAILLVCVGHAISNQVDVREIDLPYLLRFISQFHMPLFFVINGMLFSEKYVKKPFAASIHKFKTYYIPFVAYNLIFLVLHNVFAALHLVNEAYHGGAYTGKQFAYRFLMVITGHRQTFGGAMWFLGSLLIISLLFIWSKYFIHKWIPKAAQEIVMAAFVLCCVAVGVSGKCPTAFKLNVSLYSMLFFYLGYLYTKYDWNRFLLKGKLLIVPICLIGSVVIAYTSPVGIAFKNYLNFALFALSAILGSVMVLGLVQFKGFEKLTILQKIGKRSLDIMSLHFLAFKAASLIIILVYQLPIERLAEYPVLVGVNGAWWILYVVMGVSIPCLLRTLYDKVISKVSKKS